MQRGEVWWVELPEPVGSEPGFRRQVVIIQADSLNRSRLSTVVVAAITSTLRLRAFPGKVYLSPRDSGLDRPSVANVSRLATLDRGRLIRHVGNLPSAKMRELDDGLRIAGSVNSRLSATGHGRGRCQLASSFSTSQVLISDW